MATRTYFHTLSLSSALSPQISTSHKSQPTGTSESPSFSKMTFALSTCGQSNSTTELDLSETTSLSRDMAMRDECRTPENTATPYSMESNAETCPLCPSISMMIDGGVEESCSVCRIEVSMFGVRLETCAGWSIQCTITELPPTIFSVFLYPTMKLKPLLNLFFYWRLE